MAHAPTLNIVVVPSVEQDVAETVKFANSWNAPFLAISSGHGRITTMKNMQNGIEIWMNQLNSIDVSEDGTTAQIDGGTLAKSIVDTLWKSGKQTVTGCCDCVSFLGPGLGGGHGLLQGHHGLISDQFVSMNVVLADGTIRTIDAESDLWWAMKGAGHNFGIVTSVKSKIYDIQHRNWAFEAFAFTGDKVERLYERVNKHLVQDGNQPEGIIVLSIYANNPAVDKTKPIVLLSILQEGVTAVDHVYTKPFHQLGPVFAQAGSGEYPEISTWLEVSNESPACSKNSIAAFSFPIYVKAYSPQAQREAYDIFASATQEIPSLNGSTIMLEGYSVKGVGSIPSDSTAFPHRNDNLMLAPMMMYAPQGPELDKQAAELGEKLRDILHKGSGQVEMHSYVNYAFGEESKKNIYGYEPWRQERLLALKNKYDPHRRFSFYAPIA
ncbi:hypothetical protein ACHAPJ_003657 [Fusarium lateritium]